MALLSEPPTPPTRTSEALRADLRTVNTELERMKAAWAAEKRQLLGEKSALQDAANRLNAQVRDNEANAKRAMDAGLRAKSTTDAVCYHWSQSCSSVRSSSFDRNLTRRELRWPSSRRS
jgi:peptidoglycan hydrolase CwlO-like protein